MWGECSIPRQKRDPQHPYNAPILRKKKTSFGGTNSKILYFHHPKVAELNDQFSHCRLPGWSCNASWLQGGRLGEPGGNHPKDVSSSDSLGGSPVKLSWNTKTKHSRLKTATKGDALNVDALVPPLCLSSIFLISTHWSALLCWCVSIAFPNEWTHHQQGFSTGISNIHKGNRWLVSQWSFPLFNGNSRILT